MKKIFDIDKYNRYKVLYNEAVNYLNNINPNLDLNKYLKVEKKFKSKNDILYGLLVSLQNRQMSSNVIGLEKEERKNIFKELLFDYDSNKILEHYNCESLLHTFDNQFNIKNIDSKNNLWRLYAKSVIYKFTGSIFFIFSISGKSAIFPNNPCSVFLFFIAYSLYAK